LKSLEAVISKKLVAPAIIRPEVESAIRRGTGNGAVAKRSVKFLKQPKPIEPVPVSINLSGLAAKIGAVHPVWGSGSIYLALAVQRGKPLAMLDTQQIERGSQVVPIIQIS